MQEYTYSHDPKEVVDAVFAYLYNRSHLAIVLDVFRAEHRTIQDLVPEYVAEKVAALSQSMPHFYSALDDENERRFVELALGYARGKAPATGDEKIGEYLKVLYGPSDSLGDGK